MFSFVLQSLTSLLLSGVLVYAVFTSARLKYRKLAQQVMLGLAFGVVVLMLGLNSLVLEGINAPLDAKAGPLLFAGYIGGPIGGLIAGIAGAAYRMSLGGPSPGLGIFMNLAIPAIGVGIGYLRPVRDWPVTHVSAIGALLLGFAVLHVIPVWYLSTIGGMPTRAAAVTVAGFIVIGSLSILLTWKILNYAFRFATESNRTSELAHKLDLAMHATHMGMFEFGPDDPGPLFDSGMVSLYGLDPDTLPKFEAKPGMVLIEDWESLVHPDDWTFFQEMVQNVFSGNQPEGMVDFRARRRDGKTLYIRSHWTTELKPDGSARRVVGVHSDLTDIREAEQRSKATQERLTVIAENLPGSLVETDLTDPENPQVLYVSPKSADVWGIAPEAFFADPSLFAKMHDPEDLPYFRNMLMEGVRTGEPIFHRFRIFRPDGQMRWVDLHAGFLNENGRFLVNAIVLDATHEVEIQQERDYEREISRQAQRHESIGQLTGGVAHDFNNLLAVILGNLELLRDGDFADSRPDLIDGAITATLRGADLTRNMLAFARKAPLTPVVLDLNTVVRDAKNWIARTLPESVEVELSLLARLWPVEADQSSLESALLNLALNARDAMDGKGKLTIETANIRIDEGYVDARHEELKPGRYVMLAVSDTGSGIPDDILNAIFEPFFTTKPPGVGSGLGLSMTIGFMRQSGGTVQVYTELGEGTTFKLYFPAANTHETPTSQPSALEGSVAGRGQRLLLAEDEDAVRGTLVTILERAGYDVTATSSGDEALSVFEADPTYDLLLTDIVMPGNLQGTGLAKAIRERWPDLPVLFMSGYASEATVHGNGLRPEDIRLMKPVQRADLLAAVAKVVTRREG